MSRKLRTLLKHNRRLEEIIFYEPRKGNWRKELIKPKELTKALSILSNKIIENTSPELSVLSMLNDVSDVAGRPLAAFEKNSLQVVEIIFNYLRINTEFDQKFYHIFNSLQLAFTRLAFDDLSFLDNKKHPAIVFLEKILSIGYHFDKNAGHVTRFLIHAIELLIDRLANKEQVTSKVFLQAEQHLDEYLTGFEEKVALSESEIINEVDVKSRQIQADKYTTELINSKIDGDEIPIFLLDFFNNQLTHILHLTILEHGIKSEACQQILTDMDTILWSINCSFNDESFKTRYKDDVEKTMKHLNDLFQQHNLNNEYVTAFFREAEEIHKNKLEGKRVDIDVMISFDIFDDEYDEYDDYDDEIHHPKSQWNPEVKDIFEIHQLKEKHWYYLRISQEKVRCKLLMADELTEKLYFTNLSGDLIKAVGFEEQKYLATSLEMFVVNEQIHFKHALKKLERVLKTKLIDLNLLQEKMKQQVVIDQNHQEALVQQETLDALKELEKIKQEQEEKALLQQQLKAQAIEKVIKLERIEAEKRFRTKSTLQKIENGAPVVIKTSNNQWKEATLMLFSRTTQKYIFSDSSGNIIIEPNEITLIDLIDSQNVKLIKSNNSQITPIQSLVIKRRSKLSERN